MNYCVSSIGLFKRCAMTLCLAIKKILIQSTDKNWQTDALRTVNTGNTSHCLTNEIQTYPIASMYDNSTNTNSTIINERTNIHTNHNLMVPPLNVPNPFMMNYNNQLSQSTNDSWQRDGTILFNNQMMNYAGTQQSMATNHKKRTLDKDDLGKPPNKKQRT